MSSHPVPPHPTPAPPTLAEQKSDFTAEGAPPPHAVSPSKPRQPKGPPPSLPERTANGDAAPGKERRGHTP